MMTEEQKLWALYERLYRETDAQFMALRHAMGRAPRLTKWHEIWSGLKAKYEKEGARGAR